MSTKQGVASKLCVVLGGIGLVVGVGLPRASAQAPAPGETYTNANYNNRYECTELSTNAAGLPVSAVIRLVANGVGGYDSGNLYAPNPVKEDITQGTDTNFCTYTLITTQSGYALSSKGVGAENLAWTFANGDKTTCPGATGGFTMRTSTVVEQGSRTSENVVTRVEATTGNLLGFGNSGSGECFK
jgi:hypothetical protein